MLFYHLMLFYSIQITRGNPCQNPFDTVHVIFVLISKTIREDSGEPVHLCYLARAFAVHIK